MRLFGIEPFVEVSVELGDRLQLFSPDSKHCIKLIFPPFLMKLPTFFTTLVILLVRQFAAIDDRTSKSC
jgi:hypothetical protein